jgi:hypothetical protein
MSQREMEELKAKVNIFLIGMLCGVMTAAAFTYAFAIPANNDYWQMEIWKRGGATWTFDMKNGHTKWKWLVESRAATSRQKRVTAPTSAIRVHSERLRIK